MGFRWLAGEVFFPSLFAWRTSRRLRRTKIIFFFPPVFPHASRSSSFTLSALSSAALLLWLVCCACVSQQGRLSLPQVVNRETNHLNCYLGPTTQDLSHLWTMSERHICPKEGQEQSRTQAGDLSSRSPPHTEVIRKDHPPAPTTTSWLNIQADRLTPSSHADTRLLVTAAKADLHILMRLVKDKKVQLHPHVVFNFQKETWDR